MRVAWPRRGRAAYENAKGCQDNAVLIFAGGVFKVSRLGPLALAAAAAGGFSPPLIEAAAGMIYNA